MRLLRLFICNLRNARQVAQRPVALLAALLTFLGSCASASNGEASACETVCSKMRECCAEPDNCEGVPEDLDNCEVECEEELEEAASVLQKAQSEQFLTCVDGVATELSTASCADVGERKDCFASAVKDPDCADPGRAEFAESICLREECTEQQQELCLDQLLPILEDEVPCLSKKGLSEAVPCELECTSSNSSAGGVQVDQSASHLECSYPG